MDEVTFSRGPARRPASRLSDPPLQWSTGLQTDKRTIYAGWLIETGRSESLDNAMAKTSFKTVTIRHGSGNTVTHWAVETANVFVIAEGVQSITEMKSTAERYGIAYGWRKLPDGRPQSVLKMRALMRELLEIGYNDPLQISVKSTLTNDLLEALMRQYDVLEAIERERSIKGQPPLHPPFYACSIPLGPGTEVARGNTQKKEIVPVVAHIPSPIDRSYLVAQYVKKTWVQYIEGLLDATLDWSVTMSRQIAAGEDLMTSLAYDEAGLVRNDAFIYNETLVSPNGSGRSLYEEPLV